MSVEWSELGLTDEQIAELKGSGITAAVAKRAGVYSIAEAKAASKLFGPSEKHWVGHVPVLVYPYRIPFQRDPVVVRGKPAQPFETRKADGTISLAKYTQPPKTGSFVGFGPSFFDSNVLSDVTIPIFIPEGEKKMLAIESIGLSSIAIPGVTQWGQKGEKGKLHRHFAHVVFEGREVFICFDADSLENKDVRREELAFGRALDAVGALVRIVRFPKDAPKADDFIATREVSEWHALLADAREHGQLPPDTRGASDADWASLWPKFRLDLKTDKPIKDVDTITMILREHPAWEGVLAFDSRFERQVLRKQPPFPAELGSKKAPRPFADVDATRIAMWLVSQRVLGWTSTPTVAAVEAAVAAVCEANRYDPVAEYLTRLVWDKESRLDNAASYYFGAPDTAYHRAVFSKWMLSAVARVRSPGCKADYVLVLEGAQGKRKSTALQVLAGEAFFSDTMPEVGTKEAYEHCVGPWIIELAELSHMNRGDVEQIKAFVTARKPAFRHSYARRTTEHPRRCVFAGTTNKDHYLVDPTGDRRFWPLPCAKVELDALAADRDQLWAEAVHRVRAGEKWYLDDAALEAAATEEQSARRMGDPWSDDVASFVARSSWVTIPEVLCHLKIEVSRQDQRNANRVAAVLQSLGLRKYRRIVEGVRRWVYEAGPDLRSTRAQVGHDNVLYLPGTAQPVLVDLVSQTKLSTESTENQYDAHDPAREARASQGFCGKVGISGQIAGTVQDPYLDTDQDTRTDLGSERSDSEQDPVNSDDDGWDL